MSPFEVNSFLDMAFQGQDFSNKGLTGYKTFVESENTIALTNKLRIENATAESKAAAELDPNSGTSIIARRLITGMPLFKGLGLTEDMIRNSPAIQLFQFAPELRQAIELERYRLESNRNAIEKSLLGGDLAIRPTVSKNAAGDWVITPGNRQLFEAAHTVQAHYDRAEDAWSKLMEIYRTTEPEEFAAGMVGNGPLAGTVRPLVEQYRTSVQAILEAGPKDQATVAASTDVLEFITQGSNVWAQALQQSMEALHSFVTSKYKPVHHNSPIGATETQFGVFPNGFTPNIAGRGYRVVGADIARNARPAAFKGSILLVHVASSTWLHHLQYLKNDLIARLNDDLGQAVVSDIKFKIGAF